MIQYRFISSNQIAPLILNNGGENLIVEMPTAMVVNDTTLMVNAARKGLGIGRLIEPMIQEDLAQGELIPVLPEYWFPYSALCVFSPQYTKGKTRSGADRFSDGKNTAPVMRQ
ncbi:transcriptional regulator LysR family [Vibrio maritimus]|uniref:Transcriptional regulator LysR family n=1 Tax=Vibrio maritimus TaxID=990268 RepID=A0A090SH27_9VIBR|nr:transcriptional regulator LysR family [Vibrio maritimus]